MENFDFKPGQTEFAMLLGKSFYEKDTLMLNRALERWAKNANQSAPTSLPC